MEKNHTMSFSAGVMEKILMSVDLATLNLFLIPSRPELSIIAKAR